MKKLVLVWIFAVVCLLSGCEAGSPPDKLVGREYRQYELMELDPPKHVYITIKDVKTGYVWQRLYVSKHCNSWRDIPVGSVWGFELATYEKADGSRYSVVENYKDICYRVKNGVSYVKY